MLDQIRLLPRLESDQDLKGQRQGQHQEKCMIHDPHDRGILKAQLPKAEVPKRQVVEKESMNYDMYFIYSI